MYATSNQVVTDGGQGLWKACLSQCAVPADTEQLGAYSNRQSQESCACGMPDFAGPTLGFCCLQVVMACMVQTAHHIRLCCIPVFSPVSKCRGGKTAEDESSE